MISQLWPYPGEDELNLAQTPPNPTKPHPNPTENHPNPTQASPKPHPNLTLVESGDDLRVVFTLSDLLEASGVGETAYRKSWLPALEEVAPGQIQTGHGQYSRKAMALTVSLRAARDAGLLPRAWAAQQLAQQAQQARMDAAIAQAEECGAIVPVEVIALGDNAAQSLVLAKSQAGLANTFASAVLGRIHAQQQANTAQFASIEEQAIAAQAALQWAKRRQIQAQTFAALDAQAQALEQEAIATQLQQFQGGSME